MPLQTSRAVEFAGPAREGAPLAVVRGVWGQALILTRLLVFWVGNRGPLPVFFGRGACGCGDRVTDPTTHALLSWRCPLWGWLEGGPEGGLSRALVRGVYG